MRRTARNCKHKLDIKYKSPYEANVVNILERVKVASFCNQQVHNKISSHLESYFLGPKKCWLLVLSSSVFDL